jgi:hypothetical protein
MEGLRYSDRTKLSEEGSLGALSYDMLPEKLGEALGSIYEHAARGALVGSHFDTRARAACEQHFGRRFFGVNAGTGTVALFLRDRYAKVPDVLDAVEIVADEASRTWTFTIENGSKTLAADAEVESRINAAFVRHRFGYSLTNGQIRRIGSPAMDEAVVGPALIATGRPGWEQADRSYRDALHHRRGGPAERGAAITDAHAALEAAMKAAGLKGDTLANLAKGLRNSGFVLPQLEGVPDILDKLLKRSQSIRDSLGDAHGRSPGTEEVPAEVVDLAIHWTGAFIVYLADATAA